MHKVANVRLRNGKVMPMIGLGTWRTPPETAKEAVKDAIDVGYRHIDCAHIYGNEVEVGKAIEEKLVDGSIEREQLFVTSKLWNTHHRPDMVQDACRTTLKNLRLCYLDLYLMHWPMAYKDGNELYPKDGQGKVIFSDVDYVDTWQAMEKLVEQGLARAIGISNFNECQIRRLLKEARLPIANLQIECHPYFSQVELIEFCKRNEITITAYSALGSPHSPYKKPGSHPILQNPTVLKIAQTHSTDAAQILLAFQLKRNVIVIPRSVNKEHMRSNLNAAVIELTDDEMLELSELNCDGRFMLMDAATGHRYHPFENNEFEAKC